MRRWLHAEFDDGQVIFLDPADFEAFILSRVPLLTVIEFWWYTRIWRPYGRK